MSKTKHNSDLQVRNQPPGKYLRLEGVDQVRFVYIFVYFVGNCGVSIVLILGFVKTRDFVSKKVTF